MKFRINNKLKPIATFVASGLISLTPYGVTSAALPQSTLSLEQTVERLETAEARGDVLQALADVFEASGARSLQAKTKFKQVNPNPTYYQVNFLSLIQCNYM